MTMATMNWKSQPFLLTALTASPAIFICLEQQRCTEQQFPVNDELYAVSKDALTEEPFILLALITS
jgi:hypothetical protein